MTTDAYPDRKYEGAVDQISPEANRQKATILVKVKILKPDGLLRPDMNATVAFVRSAAQSAAAGTSAASQPSAASVFVPSTAIRDGKVLHRRRRQSRAARRGGRTRQLRESVRVLKGLAAGDLVIINPPADLQPGKTVRRME